MNKEEILDKVALQKQTEIWLSLCSTFVELFKNTKYKPIDIHTSLWLGG